MQKSRLEEAAGCQQSAFFGSVARFVIHSREHGVERNGNDPDVKRGRKQQCDVTVTTLIKSLLLTARSRDTRPTPFVMNCQVVRADIFLRPAT